MANRTILVDNNTWNNTHISRVGQAMSSPEDKAYEIMRELDVDYVLVIFGGLTGYASDGGFFHMHSGILYTYIPQYLTVYIHTYTVCYMYGMVML